MSSPESGSSSRRTSGSLARARPTSTRRATPSGSAATGALATLVRRNSSRSPSMRSFSSAGAGSRERGSNMSRHRRARATRARCASTRCSRTVRPRKSSGCWNVRARPRLARARGEEFVTSSPHSCTRPVFGRSNPDSTPNRVDLPAPLGPTRPAIRPGSTSMETSESAVSPPKRTVTPEAANAHAGAAGGLAGSGVAGGRRRHETPSATLGAPSTVPMSPPESSSRR